ncbi:18302_t:CDS:2 [Dentiscutata erythropus]|uniref:18302_t:CDS:1 n=1 Tax=Dentiscutata erythropus TaxID=1348616 RepID=A0A9N9FZK5_9GLOM|nr:18302_t:CDS:2 [Dentiscutata erythropus]
MSGASDELNELIEEEINKVNNEGKEVKKYEYNLFSNFSVISRSPFGDVLTATWENFTVVLKSITINTSQIDSGIINEIKNAVNDILEELKIMRHSLTDNQTDSNEKWIESEIIEGRINEYKINEFEDYKRYENTCAMKIIDHNNKEIKNEIERLLSVESHENIIKFYGIVYKIDEMDPNHTNNILIHRETLKLANFGLSRRVIEASNSQTTSEVFGVIPYIDPQYPASLPARIRNGLREKPIADTPHDYVTIYTRCWKSMQDDRPSIEEVAMAFEDFVVQNITEDDSFVIHDISTFEEFIKNSFEYIKINIKLNAAAVGQDEMSLFVNNLYSIFSKLFNEGKSVNDIITKFISQNNKTNEEVFQWLLANNNHSKYTCLLGLFYRWNIGTAENNNISTLIDAANKGDAIAQYFVGRCYSEGWNTDKDKKKAIEWYTKAADNECAVAEHILGEYYYKLGKYTKAFDFLKRAVENGNFKALNTLGLCYQRGQGTDTNVVEGFKSFGKAAIWGLPISQYELGNCYEYGIGTEINLDQALYWYQKAAGANPNYQIHLKRANYKKNSNNYYN